MKIFISAGDLSGELYGVEILKGLKSLFPKSDFFSLTKGLISEAGAIPISSVSNIGVVGATEVFSESRKLYKLIAAIFKFFNSTPPHAVILIDFPDVNLHIVARLAKIKGARILYFIPPQIWAWRFSRIKLLKRLIDDMVVILPFEETLYKSMGINKVSYFGHPLLDKIQEKPVSPKIEQTITIGILPGSRLSELRHHIPIVNEVAKRLKLIYPRIRFLLPVAPGMEKMISDFDIFPSIQPISGSKFQSVTQEVLSQCHCTLVASGTATLEAALLEVPMIVFYRVSSVSAWIGKRLIKVPFVSLPNLIAGKSIIPEFIQHFDIEDLVGAMKSLIEDSYKVHNLSPTSPWNCQKQALRGIRSKLGNPPIMPRIVNHIGAFLEGN
ncbi:MAG: lipid-A-disaccharide synthase [Thermodesulforhabdaceae bacterium]